MEANKTFKLAEYNATLEIYELKDKTSEISIIKYEDGRIFYTIIKEDKIKIFDKNGLFLDALTSKVKILREDEGSLSPSVKCVRATVKYMQSSISEYAQVICDLSPNCTACLYAIAAAHCAANNNNAPK